MDLTGIGELSDVEVESLIRKVEHAHNDHAPDPFGIAPCRTCGRPSPCAAYAELSMTLGTLRDERDQRRFRRHTQPNTEAGEGTEA